MEINVLKPKETLSVEEALDVKGGLNSSFKTNEQPTCICNCFISNKNEVPPTPVTPPKPATPL